MRDTMPQPKSNNDPITLYAKTVWDEARKFYLSIALFSSVVSATIGGAIGYAMAGGFS